MQNITKYFQKAKLPVVITDKPIGRFGGSKEAADNANRIFQMTIDAEHQTHKENFRIFKGLGNDVRVLDIDPKKQQVLLYVKEPKRVFTEVHFDRTVMKNIETSHVTTEGIRRYLMGMDERHLFISELPDRQGKINDISDAHRALKPYEVKDMKKRKKAKMMRQGEWFFVEATPEELLLITENQQFIKTKESLSTRGKPHLAEQLLIIADKTFIKGKITHEDHSTRNFFTWYRVFRNTEKIDISVSRIHGWVD